MENAVPVNAMEFAALARKVGDAARMRGLRAPGFRSPPKVLGRTRTIQRLPGGGALVSVMTRGRSVADVRADMIEGILVVNGLRGGVGTSMRRTLLSAVTASSSQAA